MSNAIVVVNVSQTQAPTPDTLQKTGAFISQGGTTTGNQTLTLLTDLTDLTSILTTPKAVTSATLSTGTVTVTTTAPHGWPHENDLQVFLAGFTPAAYNGSFLGNITGNSTLTFPLAGTPGNATIQGNVTLDSAAELLAMGTTYFSGNGVQSVYVLELGTGDVSDGVTALTTFVGANPRKIYSYLVPRTWDDAATFLSFLNGYTSPTALTYFFVTTTVANRAVYAAKKCILAQVETPGIVYNAEFDSASAFATTLSYAPNSTNRVTPLSYAFAYGVTPYPVAGNDSIFTELNTANVGWIGTGAEGGIVNSILFYGQLQDGNPFNYWYSADWAQININQALSNEVINGSNNPLAPLYYDQNGINRLQNRAAKTLGQAVTNGLATGTVVKTALPAAQFAANFEAGVYKNQLVINAEPYTIYITENPNDFAQGLYGGLACVYTPARGFKQIVFSLNVTNFP